MSGGSLLLTLLLAMLIGIFVPRVNYGALLLPLLSGVLPTLTNRRLRLPPGRRLRLPRGEA